MEKYSTIIFGMLLSLNGCLKHHDLARQFAQVNVESDTICSEGFLKDVLFTRYAYYCLYPIDKGVDVTPEEAQQLANKCWDRVYYYFDVVKKEVKIFSNPDNPFQFSASCKHLGKFMGRDVIYFHNELNPTSHTYSGGSELLLCSQESGKIHSQILAKGSFRISSEYNDSFWKCKRVDDKIYFVQQTKFLDLAKIAGVDEKIVKKMSEDCKWNISEYSYDLQTNKKELVSLSISPISLPPWNNDIMKILFSFLKYEGKPTIIIPTTDIPLFLKEFKAACEHFYGKGDKNSKKDTNFPKIGYSSDIDYEGNII